LSSQSTCCRHHSRSLVHQTASVAISCSITLSSSGLSFTRWIRSIPRPAATCFSPARRSSFHRVLISSHLKPLSGARSDPLWNN
jgi:hypothetical protein